MLGIKIKKETRSEAQCRRANKIVGKFLKQHDDMKFDPVLALLVMRALNSIFVTGACIISHKEHLSAAEAAEKYLNMVKEEVIETIESAQKQKCAQYAREDYLRHVKA